MTTESPLGEGFDNAVRAALRPTTPSSSSGKLRVANLFCGAGGLSLAAQEAGMEVVYAHDMNKRARTAYTKRIGLEPDNRGKMIDFSDIPVFDLVIATLSKGNIKDGIEFLLRFLRVRRPNTFILVGPIGENEQVLTTLAREKTQSLGYEVASAGDALLGVYAPNFEQDDPVVAGLLYLDPIALPLLAEIKMDNNEPEKSPSSVGTMLRLISRAF